MSKLRHKRPEKRAHGAFREREYERHELDERDAQRAHIIEAVSSVWSYSEIRAFAREQERDRERLQEILEIFAEADQQDTLESRLFEQHQWKTGQQRLARQETKIVDRSTYLRRLARMRERYFRIKQERPDIYAAVLAKSRERSWLLRRAQGLPLKPFKLTNETARTMREQHAAGVPQKHLATIYGLSLLYVGQVLRGRYRRKAGGPIGSRATPARGSNAPCAKLTEETVLQIRQSPLSASELARSYGMSCTSMLDILTGESWAHVGGPRRSTKARITQKVVRTIRADSLAGATQGELAARYDISQSQVCNVLNNRSWFDPAWVPPTDEYRQRKPRGERSARAKLRARDVIEIRESHQTVNELAERYGVSGGCVRSILLGRSWRHVGGATAQPRRRALTSAEADEIRRLRARGLSVRRIAVEMRRGEAAVRAALAYGERGAAE